MTPQHLSADAQATVLLCSYLALPKASSAAKLEPLKPQEWNRIGAAMLREKLRPGALLTMDVAAMQSVLGMTPAMADRLTLLLARGGQLAIELERLGSLGIWVLTRSDEAYPARLKEQLGVAAPPVLYGAGDRDLLARGNLAVVGSRDVDEAGQAFASRVGAVCAAEGLVLVSGCARGVDRLSMDACLKAGGSAIGVTSDSLERVVRELDYRRGISDGRLVVLSAVHPKAPFTVANAMARNKYIYCLSRYGLVVASAAERGGTWAGALEVLEDRWVPLFVRAGDAVPEGNRELLRRGALAFPEHVPEGLAGWLDAGAQPWANSAAPVRRRSLKAVAAPSDTEGDRKVAPNCVAHDADDLFPVVWPHIAERLARWPTLEGLAEHLKVSSGQMQVWLGRAVDLGWLVRSPETGQYGLPGVEPVHEQIRLDV